MAINELTTLDLSKLTPEQRLETTQGIVDDLIRSLNLANYSLLWRYLTDDFSNQCNSTFFSKLSTQLKDSYGQLAVIEQKSSNLDNSQLNEEWLLSTESSNKLLLCITLTPIKEFLAIKQFAITQSPSD